MGPLHNSEIVFIYLLVLFNEAGKAEGRKKQKKESGNAPAATRLPQLRHVAPLEPVWPLCTSRSPDLGSSRSLHRQSISGLRRSCSCCRSWSLRTSLAILILVLGLSLVSHVLVVTVLPAVSVLIHWSSISSHTPHRVSFHSYGVAISRGGVKEDRKMALNCSPPQCYALLKNLATKCPNALFNALMPY